MLTFFSCSGNVHDFSDVWQRMGSLLPPSPNEKCAKQVQDPAIIVLEKESKIAMLLTQASPIPRSPIP